MKGTITIFIVAVVCLTLLAGCSTNTHERPREYDPVSEAQIRAQFKVQQEATAKYLAENLPTREETLQVRECVTARTGYEYPELPADYGPHMTPTPGEPGLKMPSEVGRTSVDCVFDLGLEDRYFPPWQQETFRNDS